VLQLADSTLVGANVGTSIFDLLSAAFRQRVDRVLKPYSALERDVILDLKRLARSRRLLLVAENAHWWDADSLRLLQAVLSDALRGVIPQLDAIVVLLVDTAEEQAVLAPETFEALVRGCVAHTERTARCTDEQFPRVLAAFGLKHPLPSDVLEALFAATDGHLMLAEHIAAHASEGSIDTLLTSLDDGYLSNLVSVRFASLGSLSLEVTDLLVRAAVLGLSFMEQDLVCITDSELSGSERVRLRALVRHAESIGFIERDKNRIAFSHDVIRSGILSGQAPAHLDELYAKLAECLTILRPGDYAGRAQAHLQAGDVEATRDMVALACVSQLRCGASRARALRRVALQLPSDEELARYLDLIADGYAAVGTGDFAAPIPALRTPLHSETTLMAAERHYLAALCSMELQTSEGFAEARALLSAWIPSLDDETELRLRFLMLLQQAQVLAELFDEARETEASIERQLMARLRYDADAAVTLQIQNRRAASVCTPLIAEERIGEAVRFFRRGTSDASRDQLELYRSLTNLAAAKLRLGKDAEAHGYALEAERIAVEAPDVVKRIDVLASNAVLAAYRSGAIGAIEAVARQQLVVESPEGSDDKFLHRCNLAAFLLLASRDAEAEEEVRRLREELVGHEFGETYLTFYSSALWAAIPALHGDVEEALRRHAESDTFAEALRWPCAPHVRRRQELLRALLPAVPLKPSREKADQVLLDAHPEEIGPGWSYYARLFPCAELSFWSDS
jgi:hypothetical protein